MPLIKSTARTTVRRRIRDTVTTYEYSDTLLDTYLAPALKEIAVAIREVDPDYYLKSKTIRGFTDALDPAPSGEQGYEFYALAPDFSSHRWFERFDSGIVQYRIGESSARDQEGSRYSGRLFSSRVGVQDSSLGTTAYYNLGYAIGGESVSVQGNRIRIVPPPTAAGPVWRHWYNAEPTAPTGESEPLDIPPAFEEALIRAWAIQPLSDDGDPMAANMEATLAKELMKAKKAHGGRGQKNARLGRVW